MQKSEITSNGSKMPSALITGVSSCTGLHMAWHLKSLGFDPIFGCDVSEPRQKLPLTKFSKCDIGDEKDVVGAIESARAEVIFHLAGSSDENSPADLFRTNVIGAWHLLNACQQQSIRPTRILLVGSAAGYGSQSDGPDSLSEDLPSRPATFYGVSREAELELGRIAFEKWGLPVFLCRTFNLIGPGLSERYAPAAILRRVIDFKRTGESRFPLQNTKVIRDYIDVRDAVRAYVSIVTKGRPGVAYNVGSGKGISIKDMTERLLWMVKAPISGITDETATLSGRSNSSRSVANIDRITNETGWRPEHSLERSLLDMYREMSEFNTKVDERLLPDVISK